MTNLQLMICQAVLRSQLAGRGTPPRKPIARFLGIAPGTVTKNLTRLESAGVLRRPGSGTYSHETREIEIMWPPAATIIEPPYRVLWRMIGDELVYAPKDVLRADAGLGQDVTRG